MLSLPEEWDYSVSGLITLNADKETAVKTALKELEKSGYLVRTKLLPDQTGTGRIDYIYDIYEDNTRGQKTRGRNSTVEFLGVENQPLLNTNNKNTNKQNTNTLSIKGQIEEFTANPDLRTALFAFVEMRKKKKPLTDYAMKLQLEKLRSMTKDEAVMVEIINQSVMNGWAAFYPLKADHKTQYKTMQGEQDPGRVRKNADWMREVLEE